jgi:hypothetical protein
MSSASARLRGISASSSTMRTRRSTTWCPDQHGQSRFSNPMPCLV